MSKFKIFFGATSAVARKTIDIQDHKDQCFILHGRNKYELEQLNNSLKSKKNNIILNCDLAKLDNHTWQQWSDLFLEKKIEITHWYWFIGLQKKLTPIAHYQMHTLFEEIHVNLISATALFKLCLPYMKDNASIIFINRDKSQALFAGHSISAGGINQLIEIIKLEHPTFNIININVNKINSKFMLSKYPAIESTPKDWLEPETIANKIQELVT